MNIYLKSLSLVASLAIGASPAMAYGNSYTVNPNVFGGSTIRGTDGSRTTINPNPRGGYAIQGPRGRSTVSPNPMGGYTVRPSYGF